MVGTGRGAEMGILFRDGAALERARDVRTVVLDKTGTVTEGVPAVTEVVTRPGVAGDALLGWAASVERGSEHPLGEAVVRAAEARGLRLEPAEDFSVTPGMGVSARLDGRTVRVGSGRFLQEAGLDLSPLAEAARERSASGRIHVWVADGDEVAGLLALEDPVREHAADAVAELRGAGAEVVLLTGDQTSTARAVAERVGIREVRAEVLPGEKAEAVQGLQASSEAPVAMVGDGINDAPALPQADVGIALGSGTDIAMDAADVTLMSGDLRAVPRALRLSRETIRTIRQNLWWAFGYNVVLIPVAAGVLYPFTGMPDMLRSLHPILAALAMAFSSVSVVLNSLLLRRRRI